MKPVWYRALTVQISGALLLLFALAAGAVSYTLYAIELRKHDYQILNLAGQLRVLSEALVRQSADYETQAMSGTPSLREQKLFRDSFVAQVEEYDLIIRAYRQRRLPARLTGLEAPLYCSWDQRSIGQLNITAGAWDSFRADLNSRLGDSPQGTQLLEAARFIIANEDSLLHVSTDLSNAFQHMMEKKLSHIVLFNRLFLGAALVLVLILLALLHRNFIRPLRATLDGVDHLDRGEFGHQIQLETGNELGMMAAAINGLSSRMHTLFRLTDRISEATNLDTTLRFVFEEFRPLLPIHWLGLMSYNPERDRFLLERTYTSAQTGMVEGDLYMAEGTLLKQALDSRQPLHVPQLAEAAAVHPNRTFARQLWDDGRRSALFYPLANGRQWGAVLVIAADREQAYRPDHLDLLRNIASQVTHGFEKTVLTENLVISTVSGLAKLAENRDPETGDHLVRMSLYTALIAEQLGREYPYSQTIDSAYVRDIQRFAPMHDIGKVGIQDRILLKPGRLDPEERREMEKHPLIGGEVLRRCEEQLNAVGHSVFQLGIEIAEGHHEKYDGSGYPNGLEGEAIPLPARIVALADVFDALTSKRPYKDAWPVERALGLIREERGKHFDPQVVDAMERALPKFMEIYDRLKHV